jgi:hypothetical protein
MLNWFFCNEASDNNFSKFLNTEDIFSNCSRDFRLIIASAPKGKEIFSQQ